MSNDNAKMTADDRRNAVIDKLLEAISGGEMPWAKGWVVTGGRPQNPVSGTIYKGENALWLWLASINRNLTDFRWCTFEQAKKNGWQVRKGASSEPIFFASKRVKLETPIKKKLWWEPHELEKETGSKALPAGAKVIFTTRFSLVFNYSEIEGVPDLPSLEGREAHDLSAYSSWIDALSAEVPLERGGDKAFYSLKADKVVLPESRAFETMNRELSVMFHEYGHASGHSSRLDRKSVGDMYHMDKAVRGFEELIAESAAAMVMAEIGLPYVDNHGAYVQSWAKALRNKEESERIKEAREAFREGGRAADWVLGFRSASVKSDLRQAS